jgi:aryl-phospho-beta-D-glucosidase BglC (GH1 family)
MLPLVAFAQLPAPTHGWNLGNTLEPPGGEGAWGPPATQNLINAVADAGFNTVRIPCAWDSHANQTTYQIDPAWMARVKQVVDWCYARNLYVVLNCHWDNGWLENNVTGSVDSTINAKMNSYWTQIANTFKNYDAKLLFAGANEPAVNTAAQMSTLLVYYQTYVDAVRATGGNNSSRWLVIQGPSTDIDLTDQLMNTMPSDPTPGRLMVEVHYYSPYQFALMSSDATWGNMFYFWGQGYHSATMPSRNPTWGEEAYVEAEFQKMTAKFASRGIPVLLGEFGAIKRVGYSDLSGADLNLHLAARAYFHKTVAESANRHGLLPCYWDAGGSGKNGMWLFDRTTGALIDPDNVAALTGAAAPVAVAPAITAQPSSQTTAAGNSVSFSVSATGTAPLSYQWYKETAAVAGATSDSYTLASPSSQDAGSYSVTISNSAGSVTSNPAALTVISPPSNAVITITVE